jgi:hypothetical protein
MEFEPESLPSIAVDADGDIAAQILAAARVGSFLDCRVDDTRTRIDARQIRAACLTGPGSGPSGLRIANAIIEGQLDLRAASIGVALSFVSCVFTHAPRFDGADLHELSITDGRFTAAVPPLALAGSELPGLLANGVRIRRDLNLSGSLITGKHRLVASVSKSSAIWLTEAEIGGRVLAVGTHIRPDGDRAMQCDRTRVAGDIRLIRGFRADGEVRLLEAQLDGSLDLTAAHIKAPNGRALDLAETRIGGSFFILDDEDLSGDEGRPRVEGRIELGGATVQGHVHIRNATLVGPPAGVGVHDYNAEETTARTAILAQRLTVHGDWRVEGQTVIEGGLNLHGADIRGGVRMKQVVVHNNADQAIDLAQAQLGSDCDLSGATVSGSIVMSNARIAGPFSLNDAALNEPAEGRCLNAIGAQVDGDVWLGGMSATGGRLDFRSATIGGVVNAEGATLTNPGGRTLSLHHARIAGNVHLHNGFTSIGLVLINRAEIDGRLRCDGAVLEWRPGPDDDPDDPTSGQTAFEAISATVRSGIGLSWTIRSGAVKFTDARTSFLADNPTTDWPEQTTLTGFTYERFGSIDQQAGIGVYDATARIAWLRQLKPFDPLPWERAAHVLRSHGDVSGAERLLIAQRRHARATLRGRWRRLTDTALDIGVGYGYRPQRALLLLAVLVLGVSGLLLLPAARNTMTAVRPVAVVQLDQRPAATGGCGGGSVRCLEPFLYAVDTVVPLIDLGQRTSWYPSGPEGRWVSAVLNVCTILGWFASTVFALSITRLVRSRSN